MFTKKITCQAVHVKGNIVARSYKHRYSGKE